MPASAKVRCGLNSGGHPIALPAYVVTDSLVNSSLPSLVFFILPQIVKPGEGKI